MAIMGLKEKDINVMFEIHKYGHITMKKSRYKGLSYYFSIWRLRDAGLIKIGNVDENNRKKWKFTKKGKIVCEHFLEIKKILVGDEK